MKRGAIREAARRSSPRAPPDGARVGCPIGSADRTCPESRAGRSGRVPPPVRGLWVGALSVRAWGPLEVVADGAQVALGGPKQRLVLACLALRANSVVRQDELVEALWGDKTPAKPG